MEILTTVCIWIQPSDFLTTINKCKQYLEGENVQIIVKSVSLISDKANGWFRRSWTLFILFAEKCIGVWIQWQDVASGIRQLRCATNHQHRSLKLLTYRDRFSTTRELKWERSIVDFELFINSNCRTSKCWILISGAASYNSWYYLSEVTWQHIVTSKKLENYILYLSLELHQIQFLGNDVRPHVTKLTMNSFDLAATNIFQWPPWYLDLYPVELV